MSNLDIPKEEYQASHQNEVLSAEDVSGLLEHYYADPEDFCYDIMPNQFPTKMPWVHLGVLSIVTGQTDFLLKHDLKTLSKIVRHFTWKTDPDDENAEEHPIFRLYVDKNNKPSRVDLDRTKYTEIIMPRGFSKTTLVGLGAMLWKILYQENKFIVYVSETATAAEQQLGNVKAELAQNEMIKAIWGNIKPDHSSELKWTGSFFQTTTGIVVQSRGRGGQIRGMNVGGQRPDCILFDDVEDKESVKTVEQREKTKDWFYSDLMPALPAIDENATIIGLGTVLHRESLLMVLKRDPEWTTCTFGVIDRDGDPLWPLNMDLPKIANKKKSYALAGLLSSYYMEYESTLRTDDSAKFPNHVIILRPEWMGEIDFTALAVDPAISEAVGSDFFGIGVVSITTRGMFLIRDVFLKVGCHPDEQVDRVFNMSAQYEVDKHGVESIAYQRALIHMLQGEMFRRKKYFTIEPITHGKTAKDERINAILHPRYHNGFIAQTKHFPEYENQLLDFPNGKKDGPDVVAMAITLLDPFAANMADPDDNPLEDDEYEELTNWRQY